MIYNIRDLDEHYKEFVSEMHDDRSAFENDSFIKSNLAVLMLMLIDILNNKEAVIDVNDIKEVKRING